MTNFLCFIYGMIAAVGMGIAEITRPAKVLGFLNIFGDWDPSLLFVMMGSLAVYVPLFIIIRKRQKPLYANEWHIPTRRDITLKLILGSLMFGVGWGIVGLCPGPGAAAIASAAWPTALLFIASMVAGMAASLVHYEDNHFTFG